MCKTGTACPGFRLKTNCFYYDVVSQGTDLPIVSRPQGLHINQPKVEKKYMAWGDGAKRAPLTTCKAKRRKTRGIQGAQVSLRRNTQMFAPCPRRVLERTLSTSLLVVKRASGPHYPCTTDFVYTLKPGQRVPVFLLQREFVPTFFNNDVIIFHPRRITLLGTLSGLAPS
jgi:hypothetical protein